MTFVVFSNLYSLIWLFVWRTINCISIPLCLKLGPSQTLLLFSTWKFGLSKSIYWKNWAEGHLAKFIEQCWKNHQEWKCFTAISEGDVCSSKKDEPLLLKFLVVRMFTFLVWNRLACYVSFVERIRILPVICVLLSTIVCFGCHLRWTEPKPWTQLIS